MRYIARFQQIDPDRYCFLRVSSGLSPKTLHAANIGLVNSVCCLAVLDTENGHEVIGMGRIIGDGACHCQIVDICVLPAHQKRGLGKLIMQELNQYIEKHLPPSCYISLIADGEALHFTSNLGLKRCGLYREAWQR